MYVEVMYSVHLDAYSGSNQSGVYPSLTSAHVQHQTHEPKLILCICLYYCITEYACAYIS